MVVNNTKIEIKGDPHDNNATDTNDNGSAAKPDAIGAKDKIKEGGMEMKAIDISIRSAKGTRGKWSVDNIIQFIDIFDN